MSAGNFGLGKSPGLGLPWITGRVFNDERGYFIESWNAAAMRSLGIDAEFVQDNYSCSRRGVVRGLHWQKPPAAQGKLIRCTQGSIRDVVLDIRDGSPTYGRYECLKLSAALPSEDVFMMLFVPPGFAHGFEALSDFVEVQYKVTSPWDPKAERCIAFDDPLIVNAWSGQNPHVVSAKDRSGMSFAEYRKKPDFRWEGKS